MFQQDTPCKIKSCTPRAKDKKGTIIRSLDVRLLYTLDEDLAASIGPAAKVARKHLKDRTYSDVKLPINATVHVDLKDSDDIINQLKARAERIICKVPRHDGAEPTAEVVLTLEHDGTALGWIAGKQEAQVIAMLTKAQLELNLG